MMKRWSWRRWRRGGWNGRGWDGCRLLGWDGLGWAVSGQGWPLDGDDVSIVPLVLGIVVAIVRIINSISISTRRPSHLPLGTRPTRIYGGCYPNSLTHLNIFTSSPSPTHNVISRIPIIIHPIPSSIIPTTTSSTHHRPPQFQLTRRYKRYQRQRQRLCSKKKR